MSKTFSSDRGSTRYRQVLAAGNGQAFAPTMPAAKQTTSVATDNLVAIDPIDIDPKAMPFLTSDNHVSPETDVSSKYKKVIEFHSGHNSELPPAGTNILNLSKGDGSQKNTYNMAVACAAIGIGGNKVIYDENRSNLKPQIGDRATAIKDITSPAMPPKLIDVQQTTKIIGPPEPQVGPSTPKVTPAKESGKVGGGGEGSAGKTTKKGGGLVSAPDLKIKGKDNLKGDFPLNKMTAKQLEALKGGTRPGLIYSINVSWPKTDEIAEIVSQYDNIRQKILSDRKRYVDYNFDKWFPISIAEFRFLFEPEFRKGIQILSKTVPKLQNKFHQEEFLAYALINGWGESSTSGKTKDEKKVVYARLKHGFWYFSHPRSNNIDQIKPIGVVADFSTCSRSDPSDKCKQEPWNEIGAAPFNYAIFNSAADSVMYNWYFRRQFKSVKPLDPIGSEPTAYKKSVVMGRKTVQRYMNIQKVPSPEGGSTIIATQQTYNELISDNLERKYIKIREKD